jgi:hypothetical protein
MSLGLSMVITAAMAMETVTLRGGLIELPPIQTQCLLVPLPSSRRVTNIQFKAALR